MAPAAAEKPTLSAIGIPNGQDEDKSDGSWSNKAVSPTDSDNAEKNFAALDAMMDSKLQISTDAGARDKPATNGTSSSPPPDASSDPLSAIALTSPLHNVNWDAVQTGSLNSIANSAFPSSATSNTSLWETFKRTGPRYPPALEKLILDYHHRHSKSWQLAHDMGSGSGVYSPVLARYFRHVHVSDPSTAGLATSRQLLSAWAADNKKSRGRFTFSTGKAEQSHDAVADGTVDMAIVMEGAHLADPEMLVRSAAQTLAKDGTLALVSYSPICRVGGNPRANEAVQRLFTAWGRKPFDVVCGEGSGKKYFSQGLDFVPLPEDLFDQARTRRISINTAGRKAFDVPGTTADASDSRVHNNERRHDFSSEDNEEVATGWRQEVGPEFFRSMTAALLGQGSTQQFEKYFEEIQSIVYETSPNGLMIDVEWTVAIVLATRK
ncbi:hypothetical protein LTR37_015800 [Vermiconidia calcicola]|uniref:Uncharacterized protein n=1 Tax=Vermiconidia calcicola TaxID=1690605 RepID=A0ACC3MPK9_9PEZI|nr:hypothetical protein LTR37_015800 [Vermiconidia calcicola]